MADVLDVWTGSSERNLAQSGAGDGPGAAAGSPVVEAPATVGALAPSHGDSSTPERPTPVARHYPGHRPVRAPLTFPPLNLPTDTANPRPPAGSYTSSSTDAVA